MCWREDRGLPRCEDAAMLVIPDVRQRDDYDCGEAAIDAVTDFHGLKRAVRNLANPVQGMAPDTIEAVLRKLGMSIVSGSMTVRDLRHFTATGRPVICPITRGGGHWVVVRGVTRARVHYHCPTFGPSSMPLLSWESEWRGETRFGHWFERWGICPDRV